MSWIIIRDNKTALFTLTISSDVSIQGRHWQPDIKVFETCVVVKIVLVLRTAASEFMQVCSAKKNIFLWIMWRFSFSFAWLMCSVHEAIKLALALSDLPFAQWIKLPVDTQRACAWKRLLLFTFMSPESDCYLPPFQKTNACITPSLNPRIVPHHSNYPRVSHRLVIRIFLLNGTASCYQQGPKLLQPVFHPSDATL